MQRGKSEARLGGGRGGGGPVAGSEVGWDRVMIYHQLPMANGWPWPTFTNGVGRKKCYKMKNISNCFTFSIFGKKKPLIKLQLVNKVNHDCQKSKKIILHYSFFIFQAKVTPDPLRERKKKTKEVIIVNNY